MSNKSEDPYDLSDLATLAKDQPSKDPYDLSDLGTLVSSAPAQQSNIEPENQSDNLIQKFTGMSPDEQKRIMGDIINLAIKAPTAAIGSIVDIFSTPFVNAAVSGYNKVAPEDYQLPYAESAERTLEQGVDYLSQQIGIDTTQPTVGYEGAKLASSVAIPGGLASKAGNLTNLAKTIGTTKPRALAGAVGAGEAAHYAQEEGEGVLGQLGAGVAGAIGGELLATAANPKNIAKGATKLAANLLGLGRKSIKTEALDAAQKIGLEGLPTSAVTDSIVNRYANELIGKTPIFGDKIRGDIKKTSDQFQNAWNKVLEEISPFKHKELQSEAIYEKANSFIKDTDIFPTDLILNKIKEIREIIKSPIYGKSAKELNTSMDTLEKSLTPDVNPGATKLFNKQFSEENLSTFPESVRKKVIEHANKVTDQALSSKYLPIREIINAKININEIMADKDLFNTKEGKRSLKLLEGIRESVQDTLKAYGETNPEWYKEFKEADYLFSQRAKRTTLENLLDDKIRDPTTGEPKYRSLVNIFEDSGNQGLLKNSLGETKYKKLEDFVKVAQSMSSISQKVLNPSGSATVGYVLLAINALAFGNPIPLAKISLGIGAITKLLINKKFLNKVNQFAKEPTESAAQKIDSIIKDHLGVGVQAFAKQLNKEDTAH